MDWIPVTADVPAEGTFVLVSIDQMYVDIAFYRLGKFTVNMKQVQPNAWMMLPKPYYAGKHAKGYYENMKRVQKLVKHGAIRC